MGSLKADSADRILAGSDQALYSLLFFIPGNVTSDCYRFVLYWAAEEPDLDSYLILELSKEMTLGIKLDLFVLDLSLFLWYLLEG